MASLVTITRSAFHVFRKQRILWWFAIPVGILIGFSSLVSASIQDHLPGAPDFSSLASFVFDRHIILALGTSFLVVLCQSTLRGALVTLFAYQMTENSSGSSEETRPLPWRAMLRAGKTSVTFEVIYWLFLLGIGTIVVIPAFLAQRFNPSIMPVIFELGFLLLITLGVYLYFTKELSCLYAILGKTNFRSAVDLGFRLFRRHAFNTVLFFFYAALLALIFSLLIEYFFRLLRLPLDDTSLLWSLSLALPFGLYSVFDQILRVSFFRSIATTPKKPALKEPILETYQNPSGASPN